MIVGPVIGAESCRFLTATIKLSNASLSDTFCLIMIAFLGSQTADGAGFQTSRCGSKKLIFIKPVPD